MNSRRGVGVLDDDTVKAGLSDLADRILELRHLGDFMGVTVQIRTQDGWATVSIDENDRVLLCTGDQVADITFLGTSEGPGCS